MATTNIERTTRCGRTTCNHISAVHGMSGVCMSIGCRCGAFVAPGEKYKEEHHQPRRGDEIEAWIKRMRDHYNANQGFAPSDYGYRALDRLLDRYRECSDYGLTLAPEDDERGDP